MSTAPATILFRLTWLLGAIVLLGVVVTGIPKISLNVDILRLLPSDMNEVRGLAAYLRHFSRPDEIIVAVTGEDPNEVEQAHRSLAEEFRWAPDVVERVTSSAAWQEDPQGLAELVAYTLVHQRPEILQSLVESLRPGDSERRLEEAREALRDGSSEDPSLLLRYDPFGLIPAALEGRSRFRSETSRETGGTLSLGGTEFVSSDGTLRLIYLQSPDELDLHDNHRLREWTARVREHLRAWEAESRPQDIEILLTGEPAILSEVSRRTAADMRRSGVATLGLIALIFWLWYRRLRPLLALISMLVLIFAITLGLAGHLLPDLTVMNVGFASILIGLSVDYGVLVYQGSLQFPGDAAEVRRKKRRGILCAGVTTAAAFAALVASSLPSIAELGLLVSGGILVGALVMLTVFASLMARLTRRWRHRKNPPSLPRPFFLESAFSRTLGWGVLLLVVILGTALALQGLPPLDSSGRSMRPRNSEAYGALDLIERKMWGTQPTGNLVVRGETGREVLTRMTSASRQLRSEVTEGTLASFRFPREFVPVLAYQKQNLEAGIATLVNQRQRLLAELNRHGFSGEAAVLFLAVFDTWRDWLDRRDLILPREPAARFLVDRVVQRSEDGLWVAGHYVANEVTPLSGVQGPGIYLADWFQTMAAMRETVPAEGARILGFLALAVLVMLAITFRSFTEIAWVILTLTLSMTALLGAMSWLDWSWNFYNLAAVLLALGAGLDYSIHLLLALRATGDPDRVRRETGQALLVCAFSTVAGFGTLSWATNLGLASLGRICALALFLNALIAIFLLPLLWSRVHQRSPTAAPGDSVRAAPPASARSKAEEPRSA